ncbi:hypothetical protein BS17DRAFT_792175 [Gyrodon lividus]|nr:hypothetical protein BS17DRAFT_792175 [Gyrodon lividus]
MPNPLHEKSGGCMVLTVPLIVFIDDISRNISKQWNKHHVVYMSNASMPCEMLEKEFCMCFVSASPHAAPLELICGVKESIKKAANNGVIAWDCTLHHEPGKLQTPTSTLAEDKQQLELEKQSGGTEKVKNAVSKSGICDASSAAIMDHLLDLGKQLRKREAGTPAIPEAEVCAELEHEFEVVLAGWFVDDIINPLLGMAGIDIHQDMPMEVLHTILLRTVYILNKAHLLGTFQTPLESINKDELSSPTLGADYIVQFKGSLIGKHFKSLVQVMPYLIYDLVPCTVLEDGLGKFQDVTEGWTVIGELVVLLWHTQINNVKEYLKLSSSKPRYVPGIL